jgi:hypothetical protein
MGRWSRQELEEAFERYQDTARRAAETHDWNVFADQFTEDATYIEHLFGEFHSREAIREWITGTMGRWPGNEMTDFPIGWYIIDEDRGWIACQIWNVMGDPGDGSDHREQNVSLLKYAGDGLWSYEEDVYNPARFITMVQQWSAVKERISGEKQPDAVEAAAELGFGT